MGLVGRVEAALRGQASLEGPDPLVEGIVGRIRLTQGESPKPAGDVIAVHTDQVSLEEAREAGPVHVGHQMWSRLGLGEILREVGLSARAQLLSEVMVLNRLVAPCSEHAMPEWVQSTALSDVLRADLSELSDEALYRNLDRLHPHRGSIEEALAQREKSLFNLDDTYYLYDLTSTYFEGQCEANPKAQRGYSRDQRPDCKQVVVGLVLDRDGFPKAHEVFEGNRQDRTSLEDMLSLLGQAGGAGGGSGSDEARCLPDVDRRPRRRPFRRLARRRFLFHQFLPGIQLARLPKVHRRLAVAGAGYTRCGRGRKS